IEKYFALTDQAPVYLAAVILRPSLKWRYIDNNWSKEWRVDIRAAMKRFWEKYYKLFVESSSKAVRSVPTKAKNEFSEWLHSEQDIDEKGMDAYEVYCSMELVPKIAAAYKWWLEYCQRKRFPNL
ncbi:hypothetical protein BJ878DRAFT_395578, partial [Calycina marina]